MLVLDVFRFVDVVVAIFKSVLACIPVCSRLLWPFHGQYCNGLSVMGSCYTYINNEIGIIFVCYLNRVMEALKGYINSPCSSSSFWSIFFSLLLIYLHLLHLLFFSLPFVLLFSRIHFSSF